MWENDPILSQEDLVNNCTPAFRLSALFPYHNGHPYTLTDEWENLFALFTPILRKNCDRIQMWDDPGAKARRSKKISDKDWLPFEHLRAQHDDVSDGIFIGFNFVDKGDPKEMNGRGPASFRFFVGSCVRLDACIPLADWRAGALDHSALVKALQSLPYISFTAGFGLCLSSRFAQGDAGDFLSQLLPFAKRYPAVDLVSTEKISWFEGNEKEFEKVGLTGINWITGVGDVFVSKVGQEKLSRGLSEDIKVMPGPRGIVYQLGERPISGESGVDDSDLPLYHELGVRLSSLWMPPKRPSPIFGDDHGKESLKYERRFFGL